MRRSPPGSSGKCPVELTDFRTNGYREEQVLHLQVIRHGTTRLRTMKRRVHELSTFLRYFLRYLLIVREVVLGLLVLICLSAIAISIIEKHSLEESLYFAFITGLSIGFGDIAPQTTWGRVISVGIGLVGMIFVGLAVAVATRALAATVADLRDKDG